MQKNVEFSMANNGFFHGFELQEPIENALNAEIGQNKCASILHEIEEISA